MWLTKVKLEQRDKGQSLVEVLIALLVVTLVITSVVVAVLTAIQSSRFSKNKARATLLGQEAIEWLRSQRLEMGWGDFSDRATPSQVYCLYSLDFNNLSGCSLPTELIDQIFARDATLTLDPLTQEVEVSVVVSWQEGSRSVSSPVSATFSRQDFQSK